MKTLTATFVVALSLTTYAYSCTDLFINKGGYHIEGRTLDFFVNIAFQERLGFVGDENTTDVVLDADKIPTKQLATWKNKYGFLGRAAFSGHKMMDGLNTQGFSIAVLYLPGTKFPVYDPTDQKPALAIYDIGSFLLSQVSTVAEALPLIRSHQLVQSALEEKEGIFIKDIPIHCVIRDKTGDSAVIEFIDGQVKIHEKAGDVLTNAPSFDWQLQNARYYDPLRANNKEPSKEFSKTFHNYDTIYKSSSFVGEANLMGMPGDFTPPSRFARAQVLLNNLPTPSSRLDALYQASAVIDSVSVPALEGASPTLWSSIKDLDEGVYYVKNIALFQGDRTLYPMSITTAYMPIDLKGIDFKVPSPDYARIKVEPTNPKDIIKIISADSITITGAKK